MREPSWELRRGVCISVTVAALGLLGCQGDEEELCTDRANSAIDETADFSAYETFAIGDYDASGLGGFGGVTGDDPPDQVTKNLDAANDAAAVELEARGLTKVDPNEETPDLWIVSAAATEVEAGVSWECVPGYYWWGWYPYWDPCAWLAPYPYKYTEGTVVVALVDSATEAPVFGGVMQGILECSDDIDGRIEAGVARIFASYPDPSASPAE